MIRVMLDTDDLTQLTGRVPLLATYSDLLPDPAHARAQFPQSQLILIDRSIGDPSGEATVIDVETGAYTPDSVPAWLDMKERAGKRNLTVYCSRDSVPAVNAAAAGRHFAHWIATLDGTAHIDGFAPLSAPAAVQVLSAQMLGYHADLSLVFEDEWNPQPDDPWLPEARLIASHLDQYQKSVTQYVTRLGQVLGQDS